MLLLLQPIITDEGFPNVNASAHFGFAKTRVTQRHLQLCQTMMSPTAEGPSCDCTYQSDPWCVCTDRESGADYESADSPHFLPSDLLEGLCWADWWTAVGVGLSSERLAGDNLSALSMVAWLKTALFGFTLRWKDPPVILLFCVVPADLPLSPLSYCEPGRNYITP